MMVKPKRAGVRAESPRLQVQGANAVSVAEKHGADGGVDGAGQECSPSNPGIATRQVTPLQPKLPKERWWLETEAGKGVGVGGGGTASQVGETLAIPVQSSAVRKRRWSFAGTHPSAVEEDARLYPRTMFDELREFYDPLYRLVSCTPALISPACHHNPPPYLPASL